VILTLLQGGAKCVGLKLCMVHPAALPCSLIGVVGRALTVLLSEEPQPIKCCDRKSPTRFHSGVASFHGLYLGKTIAQFKGERG